MFKLCPIVFNCAQHIFPGGTKPPLRPPWLRVCTVILHIVTIFASIVYF